jgi:hypothetical protein
MATATSYTKWRRLPCGLRRELSGEAMQALVDDLGQAADGRTLDDRELVPRAVRGAARAQAATGTARGIRDSGFVPARRGLPCGAGACASRHRQAAPPVSRLAG